MLSTNGQVCKMTDERRRWEEEDWAVWQDEEVLDRVYKFDQKNQREALDALARQAEDLSLDY